MAYSPDTNLYDNTIIYIETEKGSGSGVIITQDGYALTCAHVIAGAEEIFVRYQTSPNDYEVVKAECVIADSIKDLAIIKLETSDYYYAIVDDSLQLPRPGTDIVILGFPFGSRMNDNVMELGISFTKGYVSSNQTIASQKRTLLDISAKAGNSGSPVIDYRKGCVLGVLSGSYTGGCKNTEEINYMIPIHYLFELITDT